MKKYILEVCANSYQSALAAQKGGASRIELCAQLDCGGITPSAATIKKCTEELDIPVFVLIRPRSGDFIYSREEFEIMKEDILFAKKCGAKGVVFGILKSDGSIDIKRNRELIKIAAPLSCTFHMAFDRVNDFTKALEDVIHAGFDRLLTAGGSDQAITGLSVIKDFVKQASHRIIIMPGSGVTPANVEQILKTCDIQEIHSSCSKPYFTKMKNPILLTKYEKSWVNTQTDVTIVKKMTSKLQSLK